MALIPAQSDEIPEEEVLDTDEGQIGYGIDDEPENQPSATEPPSQPQQRDRSRDNSTVGDRVRQNDRDRKKAERKELERKAEQAKNPSQSAANTATKAVEGAAKTEAKAVEKKVAGQVAKKALLWAGRGIAAATSEIWGPILVVVLIIFFLIASAGAAAVSIGVSQSGIWGSTLAQQSPQKTQIETLANAGDIISRRSLDTTNIQQINTLLDKLKTQAQNNPPKGQPKPDTDAVSIIDSIKAKLAIYTSNDSKVDQKTVDELGQLITKLSAKGYGNALTQYTTAEAVAQINNLLATNRITVPDEHDNDREGLTTGVIARKSSTLKKLQPGDPNPVPLNPMIPLFLLAIDKEFGPVDISSIVGTHDRLSGSDNVSAHWNGNGMDIDVLKGKSVPSNQDVARDMLQWVLDHQKDLAQSGIIINQTIGPKQYGALQIKHGQQVKSADEGYLVGHEDHVHFGFQAVAGLSQ